MNIDRMNSKSLDSAHVIVFLLGNPLVSSKSRSSTSRVPRVLSAGAMPIFPSTNLDADP